MRRIGLFEWRDAILSKHGPDPETRLVLLAIASFMKRRMPTAFPSQRLLAERTGLSLATVTRRVHSAVNEGWVAREVVEIGNGIRKRKGRTNYFPLAPADVLSVMTSAGRHQRDDIRLMSSASTIDVLPQRTESLPETLREEHSESGVSLEGARSAGPIVKGLTEQKSILQARNR